MYDLENQNGNSMIPDQISKRWSMAMANYNCVFAIIIAWLVAIVLPDQSYSPKYLCVDLIASSLVAFIFYCNGERARISVLTMDDLLANRVGINTNALEK